jgi:hypothetical protein
MIVSLITLFLLHRRDQEHHDNREKDDGASDILSGLETS